jgi:hypothetical protein
MDSTETQFAFKDADEIIKEAIRSITGEQTKAPTFEVTDLKDLISDVGTVRNQRTATNKVIDTETTRVGDAAKLQKEGIAGKAQADQDKARADQDRAQQEANTYKYFADLFGISTDSSAEIAQVAGRLRSERPVAEKMLQEVKSLQGVSFLDNPIEWLGNQIELPARTGAYNRQADIVNSLELTLTNSIKTAQDAAVLSSRSIPTITAAQGKATADAIANQAKIDAAKADDTLARINVDFAVRKLSNDVAAAGATQAMTAEQIKQRQLTYQDAINKINLADNHTNRLLRAAQLLEKLEDEKELNVILRNYDRIMGHPDGTTSRFTFTKFAEAQRQNIVAIGAGSLGADPYTGMVNWFSSRPGPAASKETSTLMNYVRAEAEKIAVSQKVQMLDEKQKPQAIAAALRENLVNEFKSPNKPGSLFYELEPSKMIASNAIPVDSHLGKVLKPLADTQTGPIPTNVVVEAIFQGFGKNSTVAGQVISDYYKKNIQLRNDSMNSSLLGVKLPVEYVVRSTETRQRFDLTKPEEATKYLLQMQFWKLPFRNAGFGAIP